MRFRALMRNKAPFRGAVAARPRRRISVLLVVPVAGWLTAAPLQAQEVRGTVTEAGAGTPVRGTFVSLVDGTDRVSGAALSDPAGSYAVTASAPGTYRLRVERVGYETWTSEPLTLARGEVASRRLEIPVRPVELADIRVAVESRCAPRPGAGEALAAAWEEVRKALEVTRWTEGRSGVRFELRAWERRLDATALRVESEEAKEGSKEGRLSFVSLPAEELAEQGYVRRDPEGAYEFFAPDAGVLVSDAFRDGHCFRLARGEGEEAGLLGLGFEPVERGVRADIRGTLWLDPETSELRHLTFEYLDFAYPMRGAEASGRVEFRRLATGEWFVRRWWIRMPLVRQHYDVGRRLRRDLKGWVEHGGEVVALELADGERFRLAERGTVAGTVRDAARGDPLAGARVRLAGTDREARAEASGRFRLDFVAPGRYRAVGEHPEPLLAGIPGAETDVEVRADGWARVDLAFSHRRIAQQLCPDGPDPEAAVLVGRVRSGEDGETLPGAVVWISDGRSPEEVAEAAGEEILEAVGGRGVGGEPVIGPTPPGQETAAVSTDTTGVFLACGLPAGRPLQVQAATAGRIGEAVHVELLAGEVLVRDFRVSREAAAALAAETAREAAAATVPDSVALRGVVRSAETGRPVAGATVRLLGTDVGAITGSHGTFALEEVPAGRYRVVTEHLGMTSDTVELEVAPGTSNLAIFALETKPVELPGLRVTVERGARSMRLEGFYKRLAVGHGDFITREDLERRDVISNFRRIAGVTIEQCILSRSRLRVPNCWEVRIGRGVGIGAAQRDCKPRLYLDGAPILARTQADTDRRIEGTSPFTLLQHYPRDMIEGIEVHRNRATAPAQYQAWGACGVVLVWTRGRR